MKLATPRWWYVRSGAPMPVSRGLLRPLSWLWAAATAHRLRRAHPADVGVPVICVGNLTMGGTGKTPVAAALLDRLTALGSRPHALSRGFGGRERGPLQVDLKRHAADAVGDEPLLLARRAPAWVAHDRLAGARAAAAAGATVIVMDDGHQNPRLKKALSLVVVDGETRNNEWPFGDGAVFPTGPMREPLHIGLERADAVVLMLPTDVEGPDPELMALLAARPVLIARLAPAAPPPPGPQLGFAGVGKPWKVERSLRAAGCDLVDFASFPDHAPYDDDTLKALAAQADAYGAGLVTTEKDWVRLPEDWRGRVAAWPVAAAFDDEGALQDLLQRASERTG
jgi:tetraacyldisaccharide 4'-kinase